MRLIMLSLAFLFCSCRQHTPGRPSLDSKNITIEGKWNGLAKEEGQLICDTAPFIVNVINIDNLPCPEHNRRVKINAIIHWREQPSEQEKWMLEHNAQGIPPAYIINWQEAKWEYIKD